MAFSRPELQQIVVVSGKGGTGKTSLAASFAALAERAVIADCDVDAADLHLVLGPQVETRTVFHAGKKAHVCTDDCAGCGLCVDHCAFDAVHLHGPGNGAVAKTCTIDELLCEGCGACTLVCPNGAIQLRENTCGEWFISHTRFGPMVHARLGPAEDNSGKLVTLVRREARRIAEERDRSLVIIDGPPGIGCPVMASITGTDFAIVVTEPTPSGLHDLERVLTLTRQFETPAAVCVNRYDINLTMTEKIERYVREVGAVFIGTIRYDDAVVKAQITEMTIPEYTSGPIALDIRSVWQRALHALEREQSAPSFA